MIEYRAYHKTRNGGRRSAGKAVRKKNKARAGAPPSPRARYRLIGWIAAGLLAVGFTSVAFASAYTWLTRSPLFTVRTVDMNRCANVSLEEVWAIVRSDGRGILWSVPAKEVARRLSGHPWAGTATWSPARRRAGRRAGARSRTSCSARSTGIADWSFGKMNAGK